MDMEDAFKAASRIVRIASDRSSCVNAINDAPEGATIILIIGETTRWSWITNRDAKGAMVLALAHRFVLKITDYIMSGKVK